MMNRVWGSGVLALAIIAAACGGRVEDEGPAVTLPAAALKTAPDPARELVITDPSVIESLRDGLSQLALDRTEPVPITGIQEAIAFPILPDEPTGAAGLSAPKSRAIRALLGALIGLLAFGWKESLLLGAVAGLAMLINQVIGAASGVAIPFALQACRIDPALASSILVTALTDTLGFLVFLGLAMTALQLF